MTIGGFVKIDRGLLYHKTFRNPEERWAFVELIALAASEPTTVTYRDRTFDLRRGQLVISTRDFARRMGWSDPITSRRFFKKLEASHTIVVEIVSDVTLITITNYCKYQHRDDLIVPHSVSPSVSPNPRRKSQSTSGADAREAGDQDPLLFPVPPVDKPKLVNGHAFDAFWQVVPKKVDKGNAKRAFAKACKSTSPEEIIAGMERYASQCAAAGTQREFIKGPAGWLNAEKWLDEVPSNVSPPSARSELPGEKSIRENRYAEQVEKYQREQAALQVPKPQTGPAFPAEHPKSHREAH